MDYDVELNKDMNDCKSIINCHSDEVALLITGCIKPYINQDWLVLKDPKERLKQYVESIRYYIEESDFDYIVFCENSNFNTSEKDVLNKLACSKGKQFEWLTFEGDLARLNLSKGGGEDEIIDYAFENSKWIKGTRSFVKVTGRLKIMNVNQILRGCIYGKNYFYRDIYRPHMHGVDTRFYICNTKFFNNRLRNCYKYTFPGESGKLEDDYFVLLRGEYINPIKYLRVVGMSGGNGRIYSNESKYRIVFYDAFCRLGLYNKCFPFLFMMQQLYEIPRKLKRILTTRRS